MGDVMKLMSCSAEHAQAPTMLCRRAQRHIACQSLTKWDIVNLAW